MYRHDEARKRSQIQSHSTQFPDSKEEEHLFACIVEVQCAETLDLPFEVPIIALCDTGSSVNWVSSMFLMYLATRSSASLTYIEQPARRKPAEVERITIRWSCESLGQIDEEGTFLVAPKAKFKMLFGCAYREKGLPAPYGVSSPGERSRGEIKLEQPDIGLRDDSIDKFRQGVHDGILLPLKVLHPLSDDATFRSIADLEIELDSVWRSFSLTEKSLTSEFIEDESIFPCTDSSHTQIFDSTWLSLPSCSEPETYGSCSIESTDPSVSEDQQRFQKISYEPSHDQGDSQQQWQLGSWIDQPGGDEPQPWVPRFLQPIRSMFSFTRCYNLTPEQQLMLEATKEATAQAAMDYWEWDEEAKNYKHFDEDSSEPVWYNPP